MRRKFITNLILLLSLNFLIKPFWVFGIDRSVQNIVGPGEYGFYFAIFNFTFILQIILDMGITNFNNRNIAQNTQLLSKHFSSIVIIRFLLAALYLILLLGIGWLIHYDSRQMYFLFLIGINQFLLSFILYLRSNISALLLFRTDSLLSVLDRLFMILICSVLLWGNIDNYHFTIESFVYAQTASYVITAIIALLIVYNKTAHLKLNWNFHFFLMIIKKSFPYALLVLLMGLYNRIDSFLIERLLPDGNIQAGIYAMAFRFFDVANNMSGVLFAALLLPIFSKLIKQKMDLSQMVKLPFTLLFILSTSVAAAAFTYGKDIMQLLYHQYATESNSDFILRLSQANEIFMVLMFAYIATSATYIFGTLLTANGSLKLLNKVAFLGAALSIGLNLILIPQFLANGSAYTALTVQVITALFQIYWAIKILKLKIEPAFLARLGIYVILVFTIFIFSSMLHFNWIINFSIATLLSIIMAFSLQLLKIKAFIDILKYEE